MVVDEDCSKFALKNENTEYKSVENVNRNDRYFLVLSSFSTVVLPEVPKERKLYQLDF